MKILVVDDDEGILQALKFVLETEGYEVILDNGRTVFSKLKLKPDLILIDMIIPGLNERNITFEVNKSAETMNIPIIFMSAHPSAPRELRKYGVIEFLAKPFENEHLFRIIKKSLRIT